MTARSPGDDSARRAFHEARAALDVAEAILTDGHLDAQAAASHLDAAEQAVSRAKGSAPPSARSSAAPEPGRDELLAQARAIEAELAVLEPRLFGDALRQAARARWVRRALILLAWLSPVLAYLVFVPFDYREGPWRVAFYPTIDFEGTPKTWRHGDVHYKWRKKGPGRDFPEDEFSGIWDTCLILPDRRTVSFRLTSDDGSRLFVDGVRVVDNWGVHAERSRGGSVELEPGVHHLRIRYYEARGPASLVLKGSLDGERPQALPAKYLAYPGDEPDPEDVCAAVRAEQGT